MNPRHVQEYALLRLIGESLLEESNRLVVETKALIAQRRISPDELARRTNLIDAFTNEINDIAGRVEALSRERER